MINDSRQKHPASHTSERTFVPRTVIFYGFKEDKLMVTNRLNIYSNLHPSSWDGSFGS